MTAKPSDDVELVSHDRLEPRLSGERIVERIIIELPARRTYLFSHETASEAWRYEETWHENGACFDDVDELSREVVRLVLAETAAEAIVADGERLAWIEYVEWLQ